VATASIKVVGSKDKVVRLT